MTLSVKIIPVKVFREMKREGDGICTLCGVTASGVAEPLSESVYCHNCDNRTVVGAEIALRMGLIKFEEG